MVVPSEGCSWAGSGSSGLSQQHHSEEESEGTSLYALWFYIFSPYLIRMNAYIWVKSSQSPKTTTPRGVEITRTGLASCLILTGPTMIVLNLASVGQLMLPHIRSHGWLRIRWMYSWALRKKHQGALPLLHCLLPLVPTFLVLGGQNHGTVYSGCLGNRLRGIHVIFKWNNL